MLALVHLIPRASFLVGCQGSHGHIRIPLDVSIIYILYSFGPITFQDGGSGYQTNKRQNVYTMLCEGCTPPQGLSACGTTLTPKPV